MGGFSSHNRHYENVPSGWMECLLTDVIEILDSQRKPVNAKQREARKKSEILYPYYGATGQVDVIDGYLLDGDYILLGEDGAPFLDKFSAKAYDVHGKIWVNNHAHILKPKINLKYLLYYLNQLDYCEIVKGSTRLKLTRADMCNIHVLLPPLEEQHRIVSKIEETYLYVDEILAGL